MLLPAMVPVERSWCTSIEVVPTLSELSTMQTGAVQPAQVGVPTVFALSSRRLNPKYSWPATRFTTSATGTANQSTMRRCAGQLAMGMAGPQTWPNHTKVLVAALFPQSVQTVLAAFTEGFAVSDPARQPASPMSHHGGMSDVPSPAMKSSTTSMPRTAARSESSTNEPVRTFVPAFESQALERFALPPSLAQLFHARLMPPARTEDAPKRTIPAQMQRTLQVIGTSRCGCRACGPGRCRLPCRP